MVAGDWRRVGEDEVQRAARHAESFTRVVPEDFVMFDDIVVLEESAMLLMLMESENSEPAQCTAAEVMAVSRRHPQAPLI